MGRDHRMTGTDPLAQRIWEYVSGSPLQTLWSFDQAPPGLVWRRTLRAVLDDNLLSRAAELGYYFLFALFPTLVCASALLGLAARSAQQIYVSLLQYLALVVPPSAYQVVLQTFEQTAAASTGGKLALGTAAALWSASVGFSAIQDGMNTVYRVRESRPYWKARGSAMLVTLLLAVMVTVNLAVLLGADFVAREAWRRMPPHAAGVAVVIVVRVVAWVVAAGLLLVQFSTIYYFAPDVKARRWHWMTPGATVGLLGWIAASLGLKVYLQLFHGFTVTYGSLGAVIVLLLWFYITGLMLLLGAELDSEIQAAVREREMKARGELPVQARAEPLS